MAREVKFVCIFEKQVKEKFTMQLADKAYQEIKKLPEPMIQEVFDFIGYLEMKRDKSVDQLIEGQEKYLGNIWNNEEDEVWNDFNPR